MTKRKVLVEDTCLREGEQMARVVFNEKQKREILDGLQAANVPYAEVGIPVMGAAELRDLLGLIRDYSSPMLIGWNRGVMGRSGTLSPCWFPRCAYRYSHVTDTPERSTPQR